MQNVDTRYRQHSDMELGHHKNDTQFSEEISDVGNTYHHQDT